MRSKLNLLEHLKASTEKAREKENGQEVPFEALKLLSFGVTYSTEET